MRKEMCDDCMCSSCMQNAEDYADGMCRECEQCREEGHNSTMVTCPYYEADSE